MAARARRATSSGGSSGRRRRSRTSRWRSRSGRAPPRPDNRRGLIGPSKNADDRGEVVYVDAARSSALGAGTWRDVEEGGRRGGYKWARASDKPSAVVPLATAEKKPLPIKSGTYALWAYVPVGLTGGEASFELRGAADGVVKGSLSLAGSGGAFRPIRGLERVRLAATGKETLAIAGSGEESQTIALDSIRAAARGRSRREAEARREHAERGRRAQRPGGASSWTAARRTRSAAARRYRRSPPSPTRRSRACRACASARSAWAQPRPRASGSRSVASRSRGGDVASTEPLAGCRATKRERRVPHRHSVIARASLELSDRPARVSRWMVVSLSKATSPSWQAPSSRRPCPCRPSWRRPCRGRGRSRASRSSPSRRTRGGRP